ncbi:MAG TPA: response regulator transcription factor [Candidatus Limnocylindrales bacterium]|nr:response regulator transcription factor [Candidatus Limnocylindrales bacterium]
MRVVIVEDQGLLRDALAEGLSTHQVEVVGLARDHREALAAIDRSAPDVVLLDIRLPPDFTDEGLAIAEEARSRYPDVAVLVLSQYREVAYAERLLNMQEHCHAVGYLLKERVGNLTELVSALQRVAAGEIVIDPDVIAALVRRPRVQDPLETLTAYERRALTLLAEGRSNLGIAQVLDCQISTVEKHLSNITKKLGLATAGTGKSRHVNVRVLAALAFLRSNPSGGPSTSEGAAAATDA